MCVRHHYLENDKLVPCNLNNNNVVDSNLEVHSIHSFRKLMSIKNCFFFLNHITFFVKPTHGQYNSIQRENNGVGDCGNQRAVDV